MFVNTTASDMHSTARVRQACDNCHRRKVKCTGDGTASCKSCVTAGLICTYNTIPKKKGPSTGKVLSELRYAQGYDLGSDGCLLPLTSARTNGLLSSTLVESCIDYFFNHVYPSEPVLHRHRAKEAVADMGYSLEAYCMIAALCAYVMIQAYHKPPVSMLPRSDMAHMPTCHIGLILLEESVHVRQRYDYRNKPSYMSVLTSWLYSGCYFGLARENPAWTYLSEATTQARLLGMHLDETYNGNSLDVSHMRMLYWVLFIAERTYALRDHHSISLYATIHPPPLDEDPSDRPIAIRLRIMIDMFKIIDNTFINLWNGVQNTHVSAAWISQAQDQLSKAVPEYLECANRQRMEMYITNVWLYLKIWQLRYSGYSLHKEASFYHSLTSTFNVEQMILRIQFISELLLKQEITTLSKGLTAQLYDIACYLPSTQDLDPESALLNDILLFEFENLIRRMIPLNLQLGYLPEETGCPSW